MNGFTFTYNDLLALANTTGRTITLTDLQNDENYQKMKKQIDEENTMYANIVATMKAANQNLSDDEAGNMAVRLGFKYTDVNKFNADCVEQMQKTVNEAAKEDAYKNAKNAYEEFVKVMGFNTQPAQPQPIINLNAVVPTQVESSEDEIDEKSMTFQERCDYIETLMSGGSGSSQFKKHLSVRHQNVGAKTVVKEWYKMGYISLAEKNSLLFLANISACSNHINVTARR